MSELFVIVIPFGNAWMNAIRRASVRIWWCIIYFGALYIILFVVFLQGALIFILFIPVSKQVRDLQKQIKIRDTLAVIINISPHSKTIIIVHVLKQ